MKFGRTVLGLFRLVARPVKDNTSFFIWMYLLGIISSWMVLPRWRGAHLYDNLWLELLLDIYLLCVILSVMPKRIRRWIRGLFYAVAYSVTLVDTFCFVKFESTLNPTMLLLVGETTGREAGEFLGSYLRADVIFSGVGVVFLVLLAHIFSAVFPWKSLPFYRYLQHPLPRQFSNVASIAFSALLITAVIMSWHNKKEMVHMFTRTNVGQVEHELTRKECAQFYLPLYRLAFSLFSNQLAAKQVVRLQAAQKGVVVDSCDYRSPCIVLIIGESYNKYHSQLYGYDKETTPLQVERMKTGRLVPYSDVIAPWNLTSFVFKNVFSTHVVGQEGEWCDYPLFTTVFRQAGYQVTFITNQFLPKAKEAVYDFSGGFFLNDPKLSAIQFDLRNSSVHRFDDGILKDYDQMVEQGKIKFGAGTIESASQRDVKANLVIFHVMGQHVNYNSRYPKSHRRWYADDYDRPDLSKRKRDILSHYDNATIYNDSIVDQILHRFEDKDAVVIYFSDHGEECFDDGFQYHGRNHSAVIDARLARQEFDVPFWIWCSHDYAVKHADVFSEIVAAKNRRMMTDALPHLLFYLAGLHTKDYHEAYNVLSPSYDEKRPRIIKAKVDYDKVVEEK